MSGGSDGVQDYSLRVLTKVRALKLPEELAGWGLTPPPQAHTLHVEFIDEAYIARVDAETQETKAMLYIPGEERVGALAAHLAPALRTPEAADLLALGAAEEAEKDTEGRKPDAVAINGRLSPGGGGSSPEAGAPLGEPGEDPSSASAVNATGDPVLGLHTRTRTRTNTNPYDTKANAAG